MRKGSWSAEPEQVQYRLTFENLYDWLETQHARGEQFNVMEPATKLLLHRYKLPFKQMTVPPKKNELFKVNATAFINMPCTTFTLDVSSHWTCP